MMVFVAAAIDVVAQVGAGGLTGVIHDQAGAVIPGVTLTVESLSTGALRIAISTADGQYAAPGLAPGEYRVDVLLRGFRPVRREGIRVSTGETIRLDFDLTVGDVAEQVTVQADAPMLRSDRASLGMVVDQRKVVDLPLNGRSFITLASLAPGVALPRGSQLPRINGGRPRTNEYLFDGISVLQPEPGQVAFYPVIDAIQEFKIESNSVPAEFGRFDGGVVNLTTKAGSNMFHGTGFEFFRNEALNARNFFALTDAVKPEYRRNQFGGILGGPIVADRTFFFLDYQGQRQAISRTVTSTVPTLLQRQGVFTEAIGGRVPVIYDPATTTPTAVGVFTRTAFANNSVPIGRMDPVALALLQRYPRPTASGTANNYTRTDNEIDNQNQFDVRIDHRFGTNRDQAFARWSYFRDSFVPVTPLPEGSGVTSGTLGPQDATSRAFASNYQHTFSDRWLNEARFGETRRSVGRTAARLIGSASASLNIPGIPSSAKFPDTLPTFLIGGYQQLGSPPGTASDFSTSVTQVADSLNWLKGHHTAKMGFDWRWERLDVIQPASPTGSFTFSNLFSDLPGTANTGTPLASLLLGQVQTFSIDLQQEAIRNRAHFQEYFIQDDWRLSDRVTLNVGTRYTLNFPSTEVNNQSAVFNLQTLQLDYLGRDGNPESARRLHALEFGPRVGGVVRLTDRTVVSAGYGRVFIEQTGFTTPFTTPLFPFLQTVSQRTLDNVTPAFTLATGPSVAPIPQTPTAGLGQGVFAVNTDIGSGYVQQWNVAVQRELGANTVLEVSYVGSKVTNVGIPDSNLNQLTVSQLAQGPALLQRVANPYFGVIPPSSSLGDATITVAQLLKTYPQYTEVSLYRNNVGTTVYQGIEVVLRHRFSHGLSYSVNYTRSKLVDDASSVFDASVLTGTPIANYPIADSHNLSLDRDYSTGDIPHVFVSSIVWDLPAGAGRARQFHGVLGAIANDWTASALVTLQSGVPVAVTQSTNFNAFAGFGVQRPNLVGDPTLPADQRTPSQWFTTAAFSVAPQFTIGTASRNPVRGPSYRDVDLALIRRVPVHHGTALELRAEIFNLLSTVNLGAPNAVFGAANFGTITTAGDPRVVQLAFKLVF
jgi:hypothetical protein